MPILFTLPVRDATYRRRNRKLNKGRTRVVLRRYTLDKFPSIGKTIKQKTFRRVQLVRRKTGALFLWAATKTPSRFASWRHRTGKNG
jgi:hypothetical protein